MGGHRVKWFTPLEVVFEFLGTGFGFLTVHDLRFHGAFVDDEITKFGTAIGIVAEAFGENVTCTGEGIDAERDGFFLVLIFDDEGFGFRDGVGRGVFAVVPDEVGEGFEATVFGHGGAGATFRAIGGKDVLKACHRLGGEHFLFELGAE